MNWKIPQKGKKHVWTQLVYLYANNTAKLGKTHLTRNVCILCVVFGCSSWKRSREEFSTILLLLFVMKMFNLYSSGWFIAAMQLVSIKWFSLFICIPNNSAAAWTGLLQSWNFRELSGIIFQFHHTASQFSTVQPCELIKAINNICTIQ